MRYLEVLRRPFVFPLLVVAALVPPEKALACHDGSPLLLDLDGGGINTTSVLHNPVQFDLDGDGLLDTVGWTNADTAEGFLWLDLNRNGIVDGGQELFGDATALPAEGTVENGYAALAVYDRTEFGGNEDELITPADLVWGHLRVWVDTSHDGISQSSEIRTLGSLGIVALELAYEEIARQDGNLNWHQFAGRYWRRVTVRGVGQVLQEGRSEDVFFKIGHSEGE